jgi:hypothetical protein
MVPHKLQKRSKGAAACDNLAELSRLPKMQISEVQYGLPTVIGSSINVCFSIRMPPL